MSRTEATESRSESRDAERFVEETVLRDYPADVRVLEERTEGGEVRYRFEAPDHCEISFDDPDEATLYADVYFEANGFREAGTGEIGVPPEIVQAGKDTLAAYLVAHPSTTEAWVASFYGMTPEEIETYVGWVRERAAEVRQQAREEGVE